MIPSPSPARWAPHVTVACVVEDEAGRLLMVEESINGSTVLNQPAGHLEPDESLPDAARRECLEETGWDVELTGLVGIYQWCASDGTPFLRFTFAGKPKAHHPDLPLDAPVIQARWISRPELNDAPNLRSPLVLRCIQDHASIAHYPLNVLDVVV